ncbi:MAG: GGDEF domain-containing protein [[Clostridium] scindens]
MGTNQSIHMLVYRQNIDAEKRQEQKMLRLAQTDEMTGLLTKTATQRRAMQNASSPNDCFAFFIFDIDNFKQANDLYGHAFGDSVILAFAATIRDNFRSNDILGRIGGDEFVAFCEYRIMNGQTESQFPMQGAQQRAFLGLHDLARIRKHWSRFSPQHGTDYDTLYQNADAALYETKERGRGGYTVYQKRPF